jgi:hypothetical protein
MQNGTVFGAYFSASHFFQQMILPNYGLSFFRDIIAVCEKKNIAKYPCVPDRPEEGCIKTINDGEGSEGNSGKHAYGEEKVNDETWQGVRRFFHGGKSVAATAAFEFRSAESANQIPLVPRKLIGRKRFPAFSARYLRRNTIFLL